MAWWDLQAIRSYIGLSGGYELNQALVDHFHSKGLYRAVFNCIMEGGLTVRSATFIAALKGRAARARRLFPKLT